MKCPRCSNAELVVTTRQDIEIDLCPSCRGIWLDRGELDKIVAREHAPEPDDDDDFDTDSHHRSTSERYREPRSRRRSWLLELLD